MAGDQCREALGVWEGYVVGMREVLASDKEYAYLDATGGKLLGEARRTAKEAELFSRALLRLGPGSSALMTWGGTCEHHTLLAIFRHLGIRGRDARIGLVLNADADAVRAAAGEGATRSFDGKLLADNLRHVAPERKYDWLLGELVTESLCAGYLDLPAAQSRLKRMDLPALAAPSRSIGPSVGSVRRQAVPTIVVIDFETANASRDSACAVGLVKITGGKVVDRVSYLIRPPTREFAPRNVAIHGITWEMVESAPPFRDVFGRMAHFWSEADYIAAHNAPFDRSVLTACCGTYGLSCPDLPFVCTVDISRALWPDLESHRLDAVCEHLGIALVHHDPQSDADACAQILLTAIGAGYFGGSTVV